MHLTPSTLTRNSRACVLDLTAIDSITVGGTCYSHRRLFCFRQATIDAPLLFPGCPLKLTDLQFGRGATFTMTQTGSPGRCGGSRVSVCGSCVLRAVSLRVSHCVALHMRNSVLGQNGNLWVRKSAKANGQQAFPDYFPVKVRGMRQTTGRTPDITPVGQPTAPALGFSPWG